MIKVMIVDDQKIFREGLKMILNVDPELTVVGLCENGKEACEMMPVYQPDVVLMDIQMPIMTGVEAVAIIKEGFDVEVIMLTTFHDETYILDAIRNGASGYLLKDSDIELIKAAIHTVNGGGALMAPEVTKVMLGQLTKISSEKNSLEGLTDREIEIAKLISKGHSNKEISEILFLGEGTIKNHITKTLQKLALRDRTQLAIYILKS